MATIKDDGLRQALGNEGLELDGNEIADADLAELVGIEWSDNGMGEADPDFFKRIRSLKGLGGAAKLTDLSLMGNGIRSLGPIAGHPQLDTLLLSDNELVDVSGISGMKSLRVAIFSDNRDLSDISALADAPSLALVDVSRTSVTDFTPLLGLEKLGEVCVRGLDVAEGSEAFETLVELGERGVKLTAHDELQAALDAELGRRKLADAPGDDEVRDALAEAGLEAVAARWDEHGPAATDDSGNTALHSIVQADLEAATRAELTRLVVAAGADVNAVQPDYPFASPIGLAVRQICEPDYLRLLAELGADPDGPADAPPLAIAVDVYDEEKRPALVEALLEVGANPGLGGAFVAICEHGPLELVERAIQAADDLNVTYDGNSALERAAYRNRDEVLRLLLEAGADPNVRGSNKTPLFSVRSTDAFDALVAAGADPSVRSFLGETVIFQYVKLGEKEPEIAAELITRAVDAGVDVAARNPRGESALYALAGASGYGDADTNSASLVPQLVELGASVTALTEQGRSAFDRASGDAVKKALKAVNCATGKTTITRLTRLLPALEDDDEAAWNAALELSSASQDEALAEGEEILAAKLKEHDLAGPMSAFRPISAPVVALLAGGVNGTDAYGNPVTHLALDEGEHFVEGGRAAKWAAFGALLDAGADPFSVDARNHSLLRNYLGRVKPWDVAVVKELVDPSIINTPETPSPLNTAAGVIASDLAGDIPSDVADEVLALLVDAGADLTGFKTVRQLCRAGRLELVRQAVEAGASVHEVEGDDSCLSAAVSADATDLVEYLLDVGVDPNIGKRTPLFEVRSIEALELLLDHGADPFVRAPYGGATPLHAIARQWEIDAETMVALFERFEELGVARDTPNEYGQTPLEQLAHPDEPAIQTFLG